MQLTMEVGNAISSRSGFSIHELLVIDHAGNAHHVGYGVFGSGTILLAAYPTLSAALDYFSGRVVEVAEDRSPDRGLER